MDDQLFLDKKYEILQEVKKTLCSGSRHVYRIRALKDFGDVKAGDLGGWIEKEENLSHVGDCWVYDDAMVYENASIFGDAIVKGDARIYGNAKVLNHAIIADGATVEGQTWIYGNAKLCMDARAMGTAQIGEDAFLRFFDARDYLFVGPIGSRNDTTTFYLTEKGEIYVSCGCFNDHINLFEQSVREKHWARHETERFYDEYTAAIYLARAKFEKGDWPR